MLRRARLADMASHPDDQTNSPGLQSPKGEGVLSFCRSLNFFEKWLYWPVCGGEWVKDCSHHRPKRHPPMTESVVLTPDVRDCIMGTFYEESLSLAFCSRLSRTMTSTCDVPGTAICLANIDGLRTRLRICFVH